MKLHNRCGKPLLSFLLIVSCLVPLSLLYSGQGSTVTFPEHVETRNDIEKKITELPAQGATNVQEFCKQLNQFAQLKAQLSLAADDVYHDPSVDDEEAQSFVLKLIKKVDKRAEVWAQKTFARNELLQQVKSHLTSDKSFVDKQSFADYVDTLSEPEVEQTLQEQLLNLKQALALLVMLDTHINKNDDNKQRIEKVYDLSLGLHAKKQEEVLYQLNRILAELERVPRIDKNIRLRDFFKDDYEYLFDNVINPAQLHIFTTKTDLWPFEKRIENAYKTIKHNVKIIKRMYSANKSNLLLGGYNDTFDRYKKQIHVSKENESYPLESELTFAQSIAEITFLQKIVPERQMYEHQKQNLNAFFKLAGIARNLDLLSNPLSPKKAEPLSLTDESGSKTSNGTAPRSKSTKDKSFISSHRWKLAALAAALFGAGLYTGTMQKMYRAFKKRYLTKKPIPRLTEDQLKTLVDFLVTLYKQVAYDEYLKQEQSILSMHHKDDQQEIKTRVVLKISKA